MLDFSYALPVYPLSLTRGPKSAAQFSGADRGYADGSTAFLAAGEVAGDATYTISFTEAWRVYW